MNIDPCPLCNGPAEKVIWPIGHVKEGHPDEYQCSDDDCPLVDTFRIEDWKRFPRRTKYSAPGFPLTCSFCGDSDSFVVVGPGVCICVDCATQAVKGAGCGIADKK